MSRAGAEPSDLITVDARRVAVRIAVLGCGLLVLLCALFSIRWQIANMLAELTPEADPYAGEIGKIAVDWSPSDPAGYALRAAAADPDGAVEALTSAVARSPNDYRWRIELGRAFDQAERTAEAEREFRKAIELAPNFSQPRWSFGNFLLRAERASEALSELRFAAEKNELYRDEVFSLIWDYSNKDTARLEQLAGDSPTLVARLAYFFAARGRAEEALRSWNKVPLDMRSPEIAKSIALGLFEKQFFREALAFSYDYGAEATSAPGAITNPSFEEPMLSDETLFGWRIMRTDPKFEAAPDSRVKKDASRSLRATFKGPLKPGFANVFQTVVVEPGARYRVAAWVRTENLRSAGLPLLEVINPATGGRLGASKPFPAGSSDWEEFTAEFTAPGQMTAVTIRTVRIDCGEDCPITGIVWYDGFRLERL